MIEVAKQTAATRAAPPRAVPAARAVQLSSALRGSTVHDAAEQEARATARRITTAAAPPIGQFRLGPMAAPAQPQANAAQSAGPSTSITGGAALPASVRRFMEPRFRADFGGVRIHTDQRAAQLTRQLSAHALTVGNQVFFGKDKFNPDSGEGRELIAHELAHTIQQGAVVQRAEDSSTTVRVPPQVQRLGFGDILDWLAEKAYVIPGYRMFTIVLGVNPINMQPTDRSTVNVLRAVIELVPGGSLIVQALDNHGVLQKVADWVDQQIRSLQMTGGLFKRAISEFIDSLGWRDLLHPGRVWDRAKRIFTEPITRLIAFVKGLVAGILRFIRDAILRPLAKLAEGTRGYDLLKAVLGQDPVTSDPYPRTPDTLIGGFMKLIGQEEIWENLKKAKAVERAFAWFTKAVAELKAFVQQLPSLFIAALKSLEIMDLILVPRAFAKLARVFGTFFGKFFSWAGNTIWALLEIIFEVVSPRALAYIKKTGSALRSILRNPLPFVRNLVRAAKLGFQNFADHFLTHLKAGLIDWLVGALPGVYIPKAFELGEIVKFVFSVLGISWANIRGKLVKVVGEPAVKAMEVGFDIVVTLVRDGPAAAWDKIKEQLGNLKDMVIGGIIDLVVDTVTKKAIPKLVSLFIPGAGFITAIIAIYDTIKVFIEKIAKIIQVVTAFIDSIVAIAAGAIAGAAKKVESVLANLLSLAISFLAGFAGLGNVAEKIMGVIKKLQAMVDKAIDWLINWIVTMAKKLFAKAFAKDKNDERTKADKQADINAALKDADALQRKPGMNETGIKRALPLIISKYRLASLELIVDSRGEAKERVHVKAKINPEGVTTTTEMGLEGDVMELVKRDLQAAPDELDRGSLNSLFDKEMVSFGPQGLNSLELRPESAQVGAIIGIASPATILAYLIANNVPLPDYGAVTAVVTIDGAARGHFQNREGRHAEEGLISFAERTVQAQVARAGPPRQVEILVSQSPCLNRCTPQLIRLSVAYPNTTFTLYYKTLYGGTSGAEYEDSLAAIRRLRRAGWRVFIWNQGRIESGVRRRR